MTFKKIILMAAGAVLSTSLASATITYTCDASIDATVAGTCSTLNGPIADLYNNTFSNVNASIYIQYGTTGLGSSTVGFQNEVTYSAFISALMATASGNAADISALAALNALDAPLYGSGNVELTSALAGALGITQRANSGAIVGTMADGSPCFTPGSGGCYNGIITITNPADLLNNYGQSLYYRTGMQDPNAYDFYAIVQHETDEVLGTSSCISTQGPSLADTCAGTNTPSAVDLFRYAGVGSLVLQSSTPGAYFSFDGGATHVATYNTLPNGNDYADWITNCQHVQDATGCLGQTFNITNDGGVELSVLDAIGYNLTPVAGVPEPGTMALIGAGIGVLALIRRRTA